MAVFLEGVGTVCGLTVPKGRGLKIIYSLCIKAGSVLGEKNIKLVNFQFIQYKKTYLQIY